MTAALLPCNWPRLRTGRSRFEEKLIKIGPKVVGNARPRSYLPESDKH